MNSIEWFNVEVWGMLVSVASVVASIVTVIGLVFIAVQVRDNKRFNRAQFINSLDIDSTRHSDIYTRLIPGGIWAEGSEHELTHEEFVALLEYLGFFEKVYLLMQSSALRIETIDALFSGRFFYMVENELVKTRVLNSVEYGQHFQSVIKLEKVWREYRAERF